MLYQLDQQQTSGSSGFDLGDSTANKVAQSFKPSISAAVSKIIVNFTASNGTPTDNVRCDIYSDNNGVPGSLIVSGDTIIAASKVGSNIAFFFSAKYVLVANTRYWFVFSRTGALDDTNFYLINLGSSATDSLYPKGEMRIYNGSSWVTDSTFNTFEDLNFQEFYDSSTVIVPAKTHMDLFDGLLTQVPSGSSLPVTQEDPMYLIGLQTGLDDGDLFHVPGSEALGIHIGGSWQYLEFTH